VSDKPKCKHETQGPIGLCSLCAWDLMYKAPLEEPRVPSAFKDCFSMPEPKPQEPRVYWAQWNNWQTADKEMGIIRHDMPGLMSNENKLIEVIDKSYYLSAIHAQDNLRAENDSLKQQLREANQKWEMFSASNLIEENEKLKFDFNLTKSALENSNRKLHTANERIVEFEGIKKMHLEENESLKKTLEESHSLNKTLETENIKLNSVLRKMYDKARKE